MAAQSAEHPRDGAARCHTRPIKTQKNRHEETPGQPAGCKNDQILKVFWGIQHGEHGQDAHYGGHEIREFLESLLAGVGVHAVLVDIAHHGGGDHEQKAVDAGHYGSKRCSKQQSCQPGHAGAARHGGSEFRHDSVGIDLHSRQKNPAAAKDHNQQ